LTIIQVETRSARYSQVTQHEAWARWKHRNHAPWFSPQVSTNGTNLCDTHILHLGLLGEGFLLKAGVGEGARLM